MIEGGFTEISTWTVWVTTWFLTIFTSIVFFLMMKGNMVDIIKEESYFHIFVTRNHIFIFLLQIC